MTPDQARAAIQFLIRIRIRGVEALTFLQVVNALEAIANGQQKQEVAQSVSSQNEC